MTNELIKDLEWRGLIYQQTDAEGLAELLNNEKIRLYCGVDPTADSMHIGHLVPYLLLRRFQMHGHTPIVLLGGGTGMIGDPGGRTEERQLLSEETLRHNVKCLQAQLRKIFNTEEDNNVIFENNYEWIASMNVPTFLRDVGKHFSVNTMLAKDSVASRLENGISFTEFSYQLIQGLDFKELYIRHNCRLQIGGSEQWGNITAGIEYVRKSMEGSKQIFGLTIPLVTKADGTKFGKTASGAVWLDAEKTSPYEFYQFWLNTTDADVVKYLKIFTFLDYQTIEGLEKMVAEEPHLREAQKTLAAEMTRFIHGQEALDKAIEVSRALFQGDIKALSLDEIKVGFKDVPTSAVSGALNLVDFLIEAKIASSKREAREFISSNAISVNGEVVNDLEFIMDASVALEGELFVIRRGKKKYFLVNFGE